MCWRSTVAKKGALVPKKSRNTNERTNFILNPGTQHVANSSIISNISVQNAFFVFRVFFVSFYTPCLTLKSKIGNRKKKNGELFCSGNVWMFQ